MRWILLAVVVFVACTQQTIAPQPVLERPAPLETKPVPQPEIEEPESIEPLKCQYLQNMSTPTNFGENVAISIAVGTDATKPGVWDLGYLLPSGLFRIGRQGIRKQHQIAIKLRGPGSVQTSALPLTFRCDNRTYTVELPSMTRDTIFYVDTAERLYWRDTDHDGTGETMDVGRALQAKHRV